jgi:DNA-binding PucR family transcriptional regulator
MGPAREYDRRVDIETAGSVDALPAHSTEMPLAVRELASELLPDSHALAEAMTADMVASMLEFSAGDDGLREELRASVQANIEQVLRLLKLGAAADALVIPVEAAELVRGLVQRGITLAALLRTYRLGHAWLWERWSQALQDRVADGDALTAARASSSAFMFAYVDRISDVLVEAYGSERERHIRTAAHLRAETVRAILGGEAVDEEVAAARLGYELRRHHVALRVSSAPSDVRGLERAAAEAAQTLGSGQPLAVTSGVASLDVWCGSHEEPATDALERYEPPPGTRVAYGTPAYGLAGFRRSHLEAQQAARIASLATAVAPAVTSYRRVELVSLLASDLPRARAFVAAQLGPLAFSTQPAQRLRETVLAFLTAGGSSTRVATELFVHQNTVAYRVKRAEQLLGRRVTERPAELICALTLAATLGPAVLPDATTGEGGVEPLVRVPDADEAQRRPR